MKTIFKIIKCTIIFGICYLSINIGISLLYYYSLNIGKLSFQNIFILFFLDSMKSSVDDTHLLFILSIKHFFEMVCTTVYTGYIFAYILNREPKLILPSKLILRHRTDENLHKNLTLAVLIGNKSRFKLHNVTCTISCFYSKKGKNPNYANGEFQLTQSVHSIDNYFRFSFDLKKFPRKILRDFITKEPACLNHDTINITISGHSNFIGNTFLITKSYKLFDIVIDEHIPQIKYAIKIPFFNKTFHTNSWNELLRIKEASEKHRINTITEIKQLIKK